MKRESECKIMANGSKWWKLDGIVHREDGPAVEFTDGYKVWYKHGKRHREDGPAVDYSNGHKSWYLNGQYLRVRESINDPELKRKYPELIESMIIYSVHNS